MWEPAVTFGSADLLKWLPDHIRARNRTGLWISGYDKSRFLRKIEIRGRATVVHVGGLSGNNAVTWCLGSLRAENDNIEPSRRTGAASLIISTLDSLNTCFCIFIPDCTHTHTHARARTHTRTQAVKSKASRREAVSLRASVCVCVYNYKTYSWEILQYKYLLKTSHWFMRLPSIMGPNGKCVSAGNSVWCRLKHAWYRASVH